MGILDKIQKKSEKIEKEKKSETVIPSDTKLKPIEPHPTINKKATVGNDETILDTYSIKIDEIEMEVVIKREEGYIYYLVPEIDKINMSLSKLTKDHLNHIKSQISDLGLIEYDQIREYLTNFSMRYNLAIPYIDSLAKFFYLVIGRLGLLEVPLNDDRLEEVMVNGYNVPVFVFHRKHQMCETNIVLDRNEVDRIIESIANLVNRPIDSRVPMLDAFLPDGSRVNATTADITMNGATLTIRKFSKNPLTVIDLINFGTLDIDTAAFLWQAVEGYFGAKPANTLIAGGTGSGKTTLLNVLSLFSMYNERIITIEDTPELQIPHKHVIKMVTRPARPGMPEYEVTMDDLIKNALRMRPDRIFVGEVRGKEAHSLLVAMNTGHDGALAYDEPIYLSDGNIINIGEFVDKFFKKYKNSIKKEDNGFGWIDIGNENIYIKSFNKLSLIIEDKRILRVWRKKYSGKLIKITTKNRREITLTHDHPVYISKTGEVLEINAEMVKVGDYIYIPKNNTINLDEVIKVETVDYNGHIYDLTVEDNHTYIAGKNEGFAVSNCSGTLHANSADEAILRLTSPPMNVPKIMLTALNFIINQQRIRRAGKTIRRILGIVEIVKGGGEGHEFAKTTLYEYNGLKDSLERRGICMWEEEVCEIAGITKEELLRDRENRKKVLSYLYKNNIRKLENVSDYIMRYQVDPEKLLRSIR
ncbi:TPA: intein-containing protein [Methanocaldococcus jannaschii]|nr:intein-containing protein [Methanocaldococcus jannaschii]HII59303.1 intein-containing protein [Methanocaldococcus jannaschii]